MKYLGEDGVNITIASGNKIFAPTWKMVMGFKNKLITWEEYVKQYEVCMDTSYYHCKDKWINLLSRPSITLLCYCKDPSICHRSLLAEMLVDVGKENGINAVYMGEREVKKKKRR